MADKRPKWALVNHGPVAEVLKMSGRESRREVVMKSTVVAGCRPPTAEHEDRTSRPKTEAQNR